MSPHDPNIPPRPLKRRELLKGAGAGVLLRALSLGLPPAWLLSATADRPQRSPLSLLGAQDALAQSSPRGIQTLILSTSSAGDPVNANCPGAYVTGAENNPQLPASRVSLGGGGARGATVWGELPEALRARLAFIHMSPRAVAHPEYSATMSLHGAVKNAAGNGSEMLASALAQLGAPVLGTLQREPLPLCREVLTYEGQPLQSLRPSELRALFTGAEPALSDLRATRDAALDSLYRDLSSQGTRAQRAFLDRYLLSRDEARSLGERLGGLLGELSTDDDLVDEAGDQVIAAVALAQLRVAPVVTIRLPFGGDNHQDRELLDERDQTLEGVGHIGALWGRLVGAGLQDQVSFGLLNVFGRELQRNSQGGRNHNRSHGVLVMFGAGVRGGVFGGVSGDGRALSIDGIGADETLEAAGATLAVAMGHSAEVVGARVRGRVIGGALV
jgi:hypothetical protein